MPLPAKFGGIIDYPSPARVAAPELHSRRCHDGSSPAYGRARISESSRLGLHATTFQFRQTKRAHHQASCPVAFRFGIDGWCNCRAGAVPGETKTEARREG